LTFIVWPNAITPQKILAERRHPAGWQGCIRRLEADQKAGWKPALHYNPSLSEKRPIEPPSPAFAALWVYAFVTFFSAFQLLPAIPFRILELGGSTAKATVPSFTVTQARSRRR
jgi:hypothetical protein